MKRSFVITDKMLAMLVVAMGIIAMIAVFLSTKPMLSSSPVVQQTTEVEMEADLLAYEWQYMPNVVRRDNELFVSESSLVLVNQDGSFAQENSPINLAGAHLEQVTGEFSISASIDLLQSKAAVIHFYGTPPIIADEFRVEKEGVSFIFENGRLTMRVWDGANQKPVLTQTIPFTSAEKIEFTLQRKADSFHIIINGNEVTSFSQNNLFSSEKLWIGLDATGDEWLLSGLKAQKGEYGNFVVADGSSTLVLDHSLSGLQALASSKRANFSVGAAVALGTITSDAEYTKVALDHAMFGSITAENAMKMINLQPQKGIYQFGYADALVKLAMQNGQTVHGHTLVFGEANPPWFNALPVETIAQKQEIEKIMIDHITQVVTHFGNKINSWDVINEPLADSSRRRGSILRNHKWFQAMGENYIVSALEAARKANPAAMLFINEYGLEADGQRWTNFLALLERVLTELEERGVTIDNLGVGFQAHVYDEDDAINTEKLREHIKQLEAMGIKAQISEMDVDSSSGDEAQSEQYSNVFNVCLAEPNCIAWRGWMLSDRYNVYKDDNEQIKFGKDGLFDASMSPRPAFLRMIESLQ